MMINIFIRYLLLAGFISTGLLGDQKKFVVRIQNPTEGMVHKYRSPEYDIAAYRPGEYLDLVVKQNLYNELKNEGYDITITQTESQLIQNFRGERDFGWLSELCRSPWRAPANRITVSRYM